MLWVSGSYLFHLLNSPLSFITTFSLSLSSVSRLFCQQTGFGTYHIKRVCNSSLTVYPPLSVFLSSVPFYSQTSSIHCLHFLIPNLLFIILQSSFCPLLSPETAPIKATKPLPCFHIQWAFVVKILFSRQTAWLRNQHPLTYLLCGPG